MSIRYMTKYPFTHEEAVALQLQRSHLQHHVDSTDAHFEAAESHLAQGRVQHHVVSADVHFEAAESHLTQARAHTASAKLLESNIQNLTGQRPLMNVNNIPSLDRKKKTRSDDNPSSKTDFKVEALISYLQAIENRKRVNNHNPEGTTVSTLKTEAGEKVHVKVEEANNHNQFSTLKTVSGEKVHVKFEVLIYLPFDESSNGIIDLTVGDERWVEV